MAAANYPAFTANTGATAGSGIVQTQSGGFTQVSLPVIVPSGAAAGQANAGDLVYLQAKELAAVIVVDANLSGQSIGGLRQLESGFYLASANLQWRRMGNNVLPVTQGQHLAVGAGTLAFGVANVPAVVGTPTSIAGFIIFILPDGTLGQVPYWK